jgi:hypothetical protein
MTDQKISTALDAMNELVFRGDRANMGVFDKGKVFLDEFVQAIHNARDAIKPLGDHPKAAALLDEMESLTQRMIQGKAAHTSTRDELVNAASTFYGATIALRNYVSVRGCSRAINDEVWRKGGYGKLFAVTIDDDIDVVIDKVTQYLSTLSLTERTNR